MFRKWMLLPAGDLVLEKVSNIFSRSSTFSFFVHVSVDIRKRRVEGTSATTIRAGLAGQHKGTPPHSPKVYM